MEIDFALTPLQTQITKTMQELENCNQITAHYGLSLSNQQMQTLTQRRFLALKNTGRVEFGEGVLKKLIYAFCDSPYLSQNTYESTLLELQDIFYYFKSESLECLSDDELIAAMESVFNGKAHGSLEYLSGTSLEALCRALRTGAQEEDERDGCEEEDDDEY